MEEITTRDALIHLVTQGRIEKITSDWKPGGDRLVNIKLIISPADARAMNEAIDEIELQRQAESLFEDEPSVDLTKGKGKLAQSIL